jgi:16S rRNA A1518/A1519 N6-dimethyltransferase RsmA/KsgA/DIM1 with predicted DNA glycosylase/AP lyase activity
MLFCTWFQQNQTSAERLVIDVGGGNGHIARFLAEVSPQVLVQDIII